MVTFNDDGTILVGDRKYKGYVRHCNSGIARKFTIALVRNGDADNNVGISVLHPKDSCYNKKLGRTIAVQRAIKRPIAHVKNSSDIRQTLESLEYFFIHDKNLKEVINLLGRDPGNGNKRRGRMLINI